MTLLFETLVIVSLISVIHVSSLAAAAGLTGIPVREISFGLGGQIRRFGIIRLRWLPIGGHVKLKHSEAELLTESEFHDAYDHQPAWVQALIPLSACIGLFVVAALSLGWSAWNFFLAGFWQFFIGAFGPLSDAQILIGDFVGFMSSSGVVAGFGFLCAKVAAVNLLPLPLLNGGDAILALTGLHRWSKKLDLRLKQISITILCALYGCWLVAIGAYLWHAAA